MIGGRVAQRVEKTPAAARMAPALGVDALGVVAHVQELRPRLIIQLRGLSGPRQVGLAAIREFDFRALTAVGAVNEQHRRSRSMRYGGRRGLVNQESVAEALDGEGRVDRMRFIACNRPCKDVRRSGRGLEPAGPQPQLTYRPGTGVLAMMGDRSGVTSTMPPQLRIMRKRRKFGNNSQIASKVWVLM